MAEPGITQTDVLKLNKPDKGYFDWDVPLNENWDKLDQLGAGQLPLMTPLDLTYKLSGAALLGWGLSGDFVDANIYTSLWDLCWAARQRAGEPVQSITVYGATYYISRDSVTGMYFTTADSYTRAVAGCGSSLGMICEYDESTGTKTLRLPLDAWTRKPVIDYDAADGLGLPGWTVPETVPQHKHLSGVSSVNANSSFGVGTAPAQGNKNNQSGMDVNNHPWTSAYTNVGTYQDGAWVQPRAHASYRYYKIGNTIQNQGMIDVGELTSAVSELETEVSRINTVMDSTLPYINLVPDFSKKVSKGTSFTATSNGFVVVVQNPGSYWGDASIQIAGTEVWRFSGSSSNSSSSAMLPMKKGDSFLYQLHGGNYAIRSILFIPAD